MKAEYHEETFSFRFTHLSESQLKQLQAAFPLVNLEARRRKDDLNRFVVSFSLIEGMDLEPLYGFIQTVSPNSEDCGIWISLLTDSDHDGLTVPSYVLEIVRRTQVSIDFSFVSV